MVNTVRRRTAPPVAVQPQATLLNWRIMRVRGQDCLLGLCLETITVRVTTPLKHIDPATLSATTASGRRYTLKGLPGVPSPEVLRAWQAWLHAYGLSAADVVDVTDAYLP